MITLFGKKCRKLRIDHNELLADMAKRLSVSASFLSAVETGKKNVPGTWIDIISNEYSLDEKERKEFQDAADLSANHVKIDTSKMSSENRELVLAFARNFEGLSLEERQDILKVLAK